MKKVMEERVNKRINLREVMKEELMGALKKMNGEKASRKVL